VDKQLKAEQRRWFDSMAALGKSYREDPEFRAQMDKDPRAILSGKGLPLAPGARVRVVVDTKDTINMVFPPASVLLVTKYGMSLCCAVIPLVLYLLRGAVRRLIMIVVLPLITNIQCT